MHGSVFSVTIPPGSPRDKSSPSSYGVAISLKQSYPAAGGGANRNWLLFIFMKYVIIIFFLGGGGG